MFFCIDKQLYCLFLLIFVHYAVCPEIPSVHYSNPHCLVGLPIAVDNYSDNSKLYGIRMSQSHNNNYQNLFYAYALSEDLRQIVGEYDVLNNFELYALNEFRAYARILPCYKEFIFLLHEKIKNDKTFRKKTAYVKGFHYSFSWGTEKSGFHDFVCDETSKIIDEQNKVVQIKQQIHAQQNKLNDRQSNLSFEDSQRLELIIKDCITRLQASGDSSIIARLTERAEAVADTRKQQGKSFDYSSQISSFGIDDCYAKEFNNTYGTQLDCQLHKELYKSRSAMMQLERLFYYSHYIQALAPFVHYYAAQAKMERNQLVAFTLSDFCYIATQVLAHGMHVLYDTSCAAGKGIWKGTKEFINPERWRDMVTGSLHLARFFIDAVDRREELDRAMNGVLFSEDLNTLRAAEEKYRLHAQAHINAIRQGSQRTYQKIHAMSWQELVENGAEIGTTMILDTLALHTLSKFTCAASGSFAQHLNSAIESGTLLREQYAVEVAGFGKLIIEEGSAVHVIAADSIKEDFVLFSKSTNPVSQQIKNKVAQVNWSESIVQKIRNVGDDILDIMEKAGGHTLEKHIAKTYDELMLRIIKGEAKNATTFTSKRTAIKAVKESLQQNAEKIGVWLSDPLKDQMILEFLHSHPIGNGILKGKKNPFYNLVNSKIVLEKDLAHEFGFKILTAFPVIT